MARSLNKVMLIGNLGRDPEIRHLESGTSVANFSLATSESYRDKRTGETITNTDWHNIVMWRGLAEIAEKYLKKGDKVYIEGKIRTRNYQDQQGNTRYITEIVVDDMVMLSKNEGNTENLQQQPVEQPKPQTPDTSLEQEEDDLPF